MSAKVIRFRSNFSAQENDKVVSQGQLKALFDEQEAAWIMFCRAHTNATAIKERLSSGSTLESGEITFDYRLCKAIRKSEK
jgi:hypothetical protein